VITGNRITGISSARKAERYKNEHHVLDGTGLWCLPGLINLHAHIHDSRAGKPIPFEYLYNLWLSCGITTIRDVGSNTKKTLIERKRSAEGIVAAPRIYLYMIAGGASPEAARKSVRQIQKRGGDGVKIFGLDRDIMTAVLEEAALLGLRVAHHVGVVETDVRDDIVLGTTSIEHWYGIPDAALTGSQKFDPAYNYSNEHDRFRYAGRLWSEADQDRLRSILEQMVESGVAWDPTLAIYESNRDLLRAQNQPWFDEYLHPSLAEFFKPGTTYHGSYQYNWTTADEVSWKNNYRIWMKAVKDFAEYGGIVGVGEDAGYMYRLYGFGLIRELELHQEAGFHPIDVVQHATGNNAAIMGLSERLGRIRQGYLADLIVVDGNPLENFKLLYPTGVLDLKNGEMVRRGGIRWTVKDGFFYRVDKMMEKVREIVNRAGK
jgi:hypothetical protein